MSKSDELQKKALECMRLAADCLQLAHATDNADLKAHFVEVAKVWTSLAEDGEDAAFGATEAH